MDITVAPEGDFNHRRHYVRCTVKTWASHADMVNELRKSGYDIIQNLTPRSVDTWHAATGICTEAGELLDAVKKLVIYNKPLDLTNVIEELGDLEFYMQQIRAAWGIDRAAVLRANMEKLGIRYADGYSDKAAQERADKPSA